MTANKRIFLNIVATYGRSLLSLACGIFTARWVLMALGKVDFGLYGVVGGLTIMISFINGLLSCAVGRFYAFSIGEAQRNSDSQEALDNCRKWFNTALGVHSIVSIVLILIGYPIGVWLVRNFLEIPANRVDACVWVFRYVCVTCFFNMFNVPFRAMYVAKQYIAELTIYTVVQTVANTVFFYYMASHPSDWLVNYAAWMCISLVLPEIIIGIRALAIFPECKIDPWCLWNVSRLKLLSGYAFWNLFGSLGDIFRGQGIAIVVNKYFGATLNAAFSVANQVNGHTAVLAAGLQGAFQPVIATACGARDYAFMRTMAFRMCKLGMLLVLLFVIPLSLELREVMRLWLKTPPEYSVGLCWCMMVTLLLNASTTGHMMAVHANGKIAAYQAVLGISLMTCLPIAWLFAHMGYSPYSIGGAIIVSTMCCAWGRVWFARSLVGMSAWHWIWRVMTPVACITVMTAVVGFLPHMFMDASFERVVVTTLFCMAAFLPLSWLIGLDVGEREYVTAQIARRIRMR